MVRTFFDSPHKHLKRGGGSFALSARRQAVRSNLMQLWESDVVYVPKCLRCHGRPRMHRHGKFERTGSDGLPTMLQRYRCPRCLQTCSVLKDGMLPYRRISAQELQNCLDSPQQLKIKTESQARTQRRQAISPARSVALYDDRSRIALAHWPCCWGIQSTTLAGAAPTLWRCCHDLACLSFHLSDLPALRLLLHNASSFHIMISQGRMRFQSRPYQSKTTLSDLRHLGVERLAAPGGGKSTHRPRFGRLVPS
jgi:hypothetical protein